MLIALDYDGTFTADPALWLAFVASARGRGHQVFVVTMRSEFEGGPLVKELAGKVDRIVFTTRRAKRPYMEQLGHRVQVWIDDQPGWVLFDAADAADAHSEQLLRAHRERTAAEFKREASGE